MLIVKNKQNIIIREFGLIDYHHCYQKMRNFTINRDKYTTDEIWLLQHNPIFTLGKSAKMTDFVISNNIRKYHSNRGGQITFHGHGQLIVYVLIDLIRKKWKLQNLINYCYKSIQQVLDHYCIYSFTLEKIPGIFVKYLGENAKIAFIGLRVHKGRSYHGFSVNIKLKHNYFSDIIPCGLKNMHITQLNELINNVSFTKVQKLFKTKLITNFNTN